MLNNDYKTCLVNYVRYPTVTIVELLRKGNQYFLYIVPNEKENKLYKLNSDYIQSKMMFLKVWKDLKFKHRIDTDTIKDLLNFT